MILNQKNFNKLVEVFNHKMSVIERDIKGMKRDMRIIGYYMAIVLTAILIRSLV